MCAVSFKEKIVQDITIKDFAYTVGVDPETIRKHVRELYPDLMRNGLATTLNEEQVTRIKSKMRPTTLVEGAVTDLEMFERAMSVQAWAIAKIQEQKAQLAEAQPKIEFHDAVTSSEKCFTMSEAVKLLNLTLGRNKFFMLLRAEKILNHDNEPYQQYVDQNYFRLTLKHVGHGGTEKVPLVTGKGLAWLQKRYDHIRLKEVI